MYHIESFEVDGFWGEKTLRAKFEDDVNIIIGKNGTGKTTLIKILQAALTADLGLLIGVQFDEIRLKLRAGNSKRSINIKRIPGDSFYDLLRYQISNRSYSFPLFTSDSELRRRVGRKYLAEYKAARAKISELVNLSWLSVGREVVDDDDYEPGLRRRRPDMTLNPVDTRLAVLLEKLRLYQLSLETQSGALSAEFQKDVLTSILFHPEFDTFDLGTESEIDFASLRASLIDAYKALGIWSSPMATNIKRHISNVQRAFNGTIEKVEARESLSINEVLPLSLLKRTRHIVELSTSADSQRKEIFRHLDLFVSKIDSFFKDKSVGIGTSKEAGLQVLKEGKAIDFEHLSSGEKQLFILLAETLLQNQNNAVFIADEPELSLHVAWQRKLISAIRELNPSAQLIAATHSPEIAGPWRSRLIQMNEVLSDG
jgi:predicted ATPase